MTAERNLDVLIVRIYNDDAPAFKEIFLLYHSRLKQFSYSITHSKVQAEEIVSDVFLKIWLKRKTLIGIKNLHLYLYISTKNLSINYLMKEKKEKIFPVNEAIVELKSFSFNPEQIMLSTEMLGRIRFAILQLPPQCQLIFKLIKEDGLKYREVAELLSLSLKTVENQMTIALKKIAATIQFNAVKAISAS
jgi:RNA polymerase sigma-70 factor (ECF subfamily)